MKKFFLSFVCSLFLWLHDPLARGAILVAIANQDTPVTVNAVLGTILQLPGAVRTVTPSQYFLVQDIGGGSREAGVKADIKTFHVKPVPGARTENVTFVLASGQALSLKFIPTAGGEKFYDVQIDAARKLKGGKFLGPEMTMMRAMLIDEPGGFSRHILVAKVKTEFQDLEFSLARIYGATDLTGYVFKVTNQSREPLDLNLSALGFGRPSRLILAQSDQPRLEPCPFIGTSPACQTIVRLVAGGPKPAQPVVGQNPSSQAPFLKRAQSERGDQ